MRLALIVVVVALVGGGVFWSSRPSERPGQPEPEFASDTAIVAITLPDALSENAQIGQVAFEAKCAACHGANAVGQLEVAPPLVHDIYEPSHHADEAFQRAVALGVRGHHWPFGDMPPVEGLTRGEVQMIVAYIRELQRANGIH